MKLKAYKVTLTAVSPLFIGSGRDYTKKEYIKLPGGIIGIVNMNKLYALAYKKKIARQLEDFMLGISVGKFGAGNDLGAWLDSVRLKEEVKQSCIERTIDGSSISKDLQIKSCMKDAYGRPYIPGSSLKGAVRTILAAVKIMENEGIRKKIAVDFNRKSDFQKNKKKYLLETAQLAETEIFRTLKKKPQKQSDAVNDIMQGFIVGDSEPITDKKALILSEIFKRHKNDVEGREKSLNISFEALRPNTKITFPLTIDEDVVKLTDGDILDAVCKFSEMYNKNFLNAYHGINKLSEKKPQILLGGGAGFVSKTLIYPMLGKDKGIDAAIKIFEKTKTPQNHSCDKELGVSPRIIRCAHYNGQTMQMGICNIVIDAI